MYKPKRCHISIYTSGLPGPLAKSGWGCAADRDLYPIVGPWYLPSSSQVALNKCLLGSHIPFIWGSLSDISALEGALAGNETSSINILI